MVDVFESLVSKITVFNSYEDVITFCKDSISRDRRLNISFLNAHAFNIACSDTKFTKAILSSDLVLRDGIGVKVLFRLLNIEPGMNLNGTDLIPMLLDSVFKSSRIAIFGSTDKELLITKERLMAKGFDIVLIKDGFRDEYEYLDALKDEDVDVVIMAMGMPKQEGVSEAICNRYSNISTINGGAIIDFMAGKVNRAPLFFQKSGLEWAYRLSKEPKRLFKRYVIGNVSFLSRAIIFKFSNINDK